MKKLLITVLFILGSFGLFCDDNSEAFSIFMNKNVHVWCHRSAASTNTFNVDGELIAVTEHGIIVKNSQETIFLTYDVILKIIMKN